jgi:hypothetical protein
MTTHPSRDETARNRGTANENCGVLAEIKQSRRPASKEIVQPNSLNTENQTEGFESLIQVQAHKHMQVLGAQVQRYLAILI